MTTPARVVMADDGIRFDGRTMDTKPLGGAETAFVELAEALAARGHSVRVCNNCERRLEHKGVLWTPLSEGIPDEADLYIANRGDRLIRRCPRARRTVFWIHNPAGYLLKWRYQWKLALRRPVIVFSGASHAGTYPAWGMSGGRRIIPYGLSDPFLHARERMQAPPPRAVFTSNPMRSLDWLLDVWSERIRPAVPGAELHIFAGVAVYGAHGDARAARMAPVLERAAALAEAGVVLRGPVPKAQLVTELEQARAFLYRGDIGETFCNAAAESQAMGVPGVMEDIACMKERFIGGETGYIVKGPEAFAEAAVKVLSDDALWLRLHCAALDRQRAFLWPDAAAEFERLLTGAA